MYILKTLKSNEFDRIMRHQVNIFDQWDRMFTDAHFNRSLSNNFPPHNIRRKDNSYLIEMAVAGFAKSEISITREKEYLHISSVKEEKEQEGMLYQGIAGRSFKKSFALGERIKVLGAELKDGMLYIALQEEVPEEEKPQKIEIGKVNSKFGIPLMRS